MRETPKAAAAFEAYWALGDGRNCETVARQLGKSIALIERWSRLHDWQERLKARQEEQGRERDRLRNAAIAEAEARLLAEGIELQALAVAAIREKAEQGCLGAVAAVQAAALGAKLELRGLRLPETITRQELAAPGRGDLTFTIQIDRGGRASEA